MKKLLTLILALAMLLAMGSAALADYYSNLLPVVTTYPPEFKGKTVILQINIHGGEAQGDEDGIDHGIKAEVKVGIVPGVFLQMPDCANPINSSGDFPCSFAFYAVCFLYRASPNGDLPPLPFVWRRFAEPYL